ncbi:MAG: hypothetical protein MHPSP_003506, partial [Paramarteilia canceri]
MEFMPTRKIHNWLLRFTDRMTFQYLRDHNFVERAFSRNSPEKCRKQVIHFGINRPWTPQFLLHNINSNSKLKLSEGKGQMKHPKAATFFRGDK